MRIAITNCFFMVFIWVAPVFAGKNFDKGELVRLKRSSCKAAIFETNGSLSALDSSDENQLGSREDTLNDQARFNICKAYYQGRDHSFFPSEVEERAYIFDSLAMKEGRDIARKRNLAKNRENYRKKHPPEPQLDDEQLNFVRSYEISDDDQNEQVQNKKGKNNKPSKKIKRSSSASRMTTVNIKNCCQQGESRKTRKRANTL